MIECLKNIKIILLMQKSNLRKNKNNKTHQNNRTHNSNNKTNNKKYQTHNNKTINKNLMMDLIFLCKIISMTLISNSFRNSKIKWNNFDLVLIILFHFINIYLSTVIKQIS